MPRSLVRLSVLLLLTVCGTFSQLEDSEMLAAVSKLSDNFSRLKELGLAVDDLQREYASADIRYSPVGDLSTLLSSAQVPQSRVREVLEAIDAIVTGTETNTRSVIDCCTISTATSNPCCHGCDVTTSVELETAAQSIVSSGLNVEVEFKVGFSNGSVLVRPFVPFQGTCTRMDSRLMPWYNSVTETKPREVVIFLDLNEDGVVGNSSKSELRDAAIGVIQSLGARDKVAVVLVTDNKQGDCPDQGFLGNATVEVKNELIGFIEEAVGLDSNRNYPVDFTAAFNYFTTSSSTDKLLLLITDGRGTITQTELDTFMTAVDTMLSADTFNFIMYTANVPDPGNGFLNYLRGFTVGNKFNPLSAIAEYASVVFTVDTPPESLHITTEFNRNNELSLSISRVWLNNGDIVGVVNALLPWRYVMTEVAALAVPRPSSYYFMINQEGNLMYHDLFDKMNVVDLQPTVLETEEEFLNTVEPKITNGESVSLVSVTKTVVVNYEGSYVNRAVPSSYNCQSVITINDAEPVNSGLIHVCVVVATEDLQIMTSISVPDVADVYRGNPSRFPVYNTLLSSLYKCNSLCMSSVENRSSVQLTAPQTPPSTDSDVVSYLRGTGTRPAGISEYIAEEVAVVSIAGLGWLNSLSSPEFMPIERRHLATPTGVYLGYPAVELNSSFVPQYLPWYITAAANRGSLSLSASHTDQLDGVGVVYTASYPISNGAGVLLSVVAAEVTESSLRDCVNEALDGICQEDGYKCMVVNSIGDFVLHPSSHKDEDSILDVEEYAGIVRRLLDDRLLVKLGCNTVTPTGISHRIYYTLSVNESLPVCFTPSQGCYNICISSISGTDSFLLVAAEKEMCDSNAFRFCSATCIDCNVFNPLSVECPCVCNVETCVEPTNIELPTCPAQNTPPSNYKQSSDESPCVPFSTCCSGYSACCRDDALPFCVSEDCETETGNEMCSFDPVPTETPESTTDSSSTIDRQGAIIGGVIGGVFGLALLGLLIACCVWYQFCKEPETSSSKERSDFNFTDIKVSTVNKTAIELKGMEPLPDGEKAKPASSVATVGNDYGVVV